MLPSLSQGAQEAASFLDLKGTISYCRTPSRDILVNIAMVQYTFSGKQHLYLEVSWKLKNKKPYQTTKESTRNLLRSNTKRGFSNNHKRFRRNNETPRNRKQAYNMKQTKTGCRQQSQWNNNLGNLLTMVNEERWDDSQHTFIITIQPNQLFLVLGTSTQ